MVARYGRREVIAILVGGHRSEAVAAAARVPDLGIDHAGAPTRP
jgi:hypothetical protein